MRPNGARNAIVFALFRTGQPQYPYRQVRQFAAEKREIMQVNSARVALPVGSRTPPVRPFMMPFTFAQRMAGTAYALTDDASLKLSAYDRGALSVPPDTTLSA